MVYVATIVAGGDQVHVISLAVEKDCSINGDQAVYAQMVNTNGNQILQFVTTTASPLLFQVRPPYSSELLIMRRAYSEFFDRPEEQAALLPVEPTER